MADLPEEERAGALRRVSEVAVRRAETIAALDRELREAAVDAARIGAQRSRIKELAGISPSTLYRWLTEAGLEVRAKRPAAKGEA